MTSRRIVSHLVSRRAGRVAALSGAVCLAALGACGGSSGDAPRRDAGPEADDGSTAPGDGGLPDATLPDGGVTGGDGGPPPSEASDASFRADAAPDMGALEAGACGDPFGGGPTTATTMHLDIGVHDPSMIWDGHRYYLFATGGTLNVRSSTDILSWVDAGNVFSSIPAWVTSALGGNPGGTPPNLWAPDISYFGGSFHVYYAGSTFGSNTSVIGLATSPSLAGHSWTDQQLVVQSTSADDFNAIDPNVSFDANCTPWLAFGSFWSGIKLRKLDAITGKLAADDTTTYSLASRNGGAIEAASIISHNGFYYLFVSFDACCQGVNSTYRTMVGRGTSITGPYADMAGTDMMQGAAEQLLASTGRYIGPGGGTAWKDGDTYLYAYHYYDGDGGGASKLQVRPIEFDANDWITLGDPLFE
ncbi:MAG TPA: arabinan endo-1,5-alpha-L-arabinosidase [Polyangiaceae bacterium]